MKRITRLANKKDVDGIYEIEAANFEFPWSKKSIENSIVNDDLQDIVITEVDGTLVGYISYMIVFDEIHIANVAVKSEFRGQKISLDLFDFLTKKADDEKLKITLEVAEKNKIAINLYRKYNFKISGKRNNYYGIDRDAYIMWRE
ncbi:MAG: ribosomal protein S18-alanine N-acetyltransferase [Peptoniphilus harei]|uniref:ribosomal protein S18-alanine N-acetyltransferase n=1 Tax=uncultured Peptoniphilus sp. TaxID=254354 RepID=UPI0025871EE0|nr:ribosomal protein S18-alanine N-acetyltransferase [uncultured Peptoniphilus sp.]MDU3010943.1 ribosomal protein S18-alanine N-acetyltransferase [Peptoniphilus harei]MDU6782904.1 ribosomal protein S18-alanine N-acetyltransferase [Peptoniphilus harei]MDU7115464.1 ribosomal protein S18-alanine N-acetyltransferase [Peptoniphilus harei]